MRGSPMLLLTHADMLLLLLLLLLLSSTLQDGFKKFTEYMNRMFDQYNLVRPTATVQVKDLTVTTQVSSWRAAGHLWGSVAAGSGRIRKA
jgi:hypothetical protein